MPVKISQLPTASLVTSDDFFPIVDSGSLTTQKASAQQILNFITGSTFNILNISGNLTVDGKITAQEYHTEVISASIIYESGSTKFGNDSSDTHQFSGSILLSGTLNANSTLSGTVAQFVNITASNVTIGLAEDGDYTDGLFTSFTSLTPVGLVVDKFNEVLKGLAPQPAPSLSNLERNTAGGTSINLSFGASSSTGSYTNVTASLSGLVNVDIGGTFSVTNGSGGNPIRLGAFTALTALTLTLNNNVAANAGAFTNYPADSLNVSPDGIGTFTIEMNGADIIPTGTPSSTAVYNANNFNLSLANTASFISSGQSFDLFRHRTGTVSIPTANWRVGHNYVKVTHVSSLGTNVTNFIDWIYDPQAASGNSVYGFTTTSSSFTPGGLKELSGIKYYQTCTYNFNSLISNYYKNVYSTAANGGITIGSFSPASGLSAATFASTPAPTTSDDVLSRTSLHTLTGVRVLSASLASTMTVNNTLGKTGNTTLTTPKILFDNVNTANTDVLENFCLENYRVSSASYDTQISLTTAAAFPSGSSLSTSELVVYNGGVAYPTTILNNGNVAGSGIEYMLGSQPNYAGVTQDRYYFRKFVNGASVLATFNLILTGSNINFTPFGGSLTGNNIKIAIKIPGTTGWRDVCTSAPGSTGGSLSDNIGCFGGDFSTSAPANITTSAGRSIPINFVNESVGSNQSYIVRVFASKDWTGSITKIQIA